MHEFRRRIAIAFFFNDPTLARSHPDGTLTLASVIALLKEDRFRIGRQTDYAQLAAEMHLLNLAVDDGSHRPQEQGERAFNAEVDELTRQLKHIWGSINDAGVSFMSRTEAKSVIEWVQERLMYTVRTRPQPKQSIFDTPDREDPSLPRQQDYMRKFFRKEKPAAGMDAVAAGDDS